MKEIDKKSYSDYDYITMNNVKVDEATMEKYKKSAKKILALKLSECEKICTGLRDTQMEISKSNKDEIFYSGDYEGTTVFFNENNKMCQFIRLNEMLCVIDDKYRIYRFIGSDSIPDTLEMPYCLIENVYKGELLTDISNL